jgi:hypothetical protein
MSTINIGRGSSHFYCNLIKAYLRNYEKVSVIAGGLRINLGVWTCYYIKNIFHVERINVHFVEDIRVHTIFSFDVYRGPPKVSIPPELPPCETSLRIRHSMNMKFLRDQLDNTSSIEILAAGTLCYRALFLTTFAYKKGFHMKDIDIHWVGDKVGIKIPVYKIQ